VLNNSEIFFKNPQSADGNYLLRACGKVGATKRSLHGWSVRHSSSFADSKKHFFFGTFFFCFGKKKVRSKKEKNCIVQQHITTAKEKY
jgi:hypothetical protein